MGRNSEGEAQSLADLSAQPSPHPGLRCDRWPLRFCGADAAEGRDRDQVGGRVGEQRGGRAEELHQQPAEAGAADLRCGGAGLQLGIALQQRLAVDQRRQVCEVGDVEEDGEDPDREGEHVQVRHAQPVRGGEQGNQPDQQGAAEVAADQDGTAPIAVDQRPGQQRHQQERREACGVEQAELAGVRAQRVDRHQRQRQLGDLRAEQRDGLARPQLEEVAVAPQPGPAGPLLDGLRLHGGSIPLTITNESTLPVMLPPGFATLRHGSHV